MRAKTVDRMYAHYREAFTVGARVRYTKAYKAKFASIRNDDRVFIVSHFDARGGYMVPSLTLTNLEGKIECSIMADNVELVEDGAK